MAEPLTLNDAKNFLKVEHNTDDVLIGALIETSRLQVEAATGVVLNDDATPAPKPLIHAIRLLVAHWYDNRGLVSIGQSVAMMPPSVNAMIASHRVLSL